MQYDVFFYEAFAEEEPGLRQFLPPRWKAGYSAETIQESGHTAPPARVLSIRTQSQLPPSWDSAIAAVQARSTGYDHLLPWRARAGDRVQWGALPKYCGRAVAEQAMLMTLALLRKLPLQLSSFASFTRDGLTGRETAGRALLVVGVGDIGHHVVELARGWGMNVRGVDPVRRHADVTYADLEEGLAWADAIVSCMNLNDSNRALFRYEVLRLARPGTVFVNVGRGESSPADGLLRLLEEGHLGGVGLDVFNDEQRVAIALRQGAERAGHEEVDALRRMKLRTDVLLTPHNAFNTQEALLRKCEFSARQIDHLLLHGTFLWPLA